MTQAGAIPALVALLASGTPIAKQFAAAALFTVPGNPDEQGRVCVRPSPLHPTPDPSAMSAVQTVHLLNIMTPYSSIMLQRSTH